MTSIAPSTCRNDDNNVALPLTNNDLGQTTLHILCQDPNSNVEIIGKEVSKHSEAIEVKDFFGRSPIFYAIKCHAQAAVIRLLFSKQPEMVLATDSCGDSAIYMLYQNSRDTSLLEMVFQDHPEFAILQAKSISTLSVFDKSCNVWKSEDCSEQNDSLGWRKHVITVLAAHRCKYGNTMNTNEELHFALEMCLDPRLVCKYVQIYPEQLFTPMKRAEQQLPLHYILARYPSHRSAALLRCVLYKAPSCASISYRNQFPLHISLKSGFEWHHGVKELIMAFPEALGAPDRLTALAPFLIAGSEATASLSTVFSVLRSQPLAHSIADTRFVSTA